MASSKAVIVKGDEPGAMSNFSGGVRGSWDKFSHFLADVRSEMRKVVAPSRKEVESTTTVVLIAVFIFGLFFFVTDYVFNSVMHQIITRLGGAQ